jgi:hypothetical protein
MVELALFHLITGRIFKSYILTIGFYNYYTNYLFRKDATYKYSSDNHNKSSKIKRQYLMHKDV